MITEKEMKLIKKKYFKIISMNYFAIYLQSKNTKHYWGIQVAEFPHFRNFKVYHKHHLHDRYHRHNDVDTLELAIKYIMNHDNFQLTGRKITRYTR